MEKQTKKWDGTPILTRPDAESAPPEAPKKQAEWGWSNFPNIFGTDSIGFTEFVKRFAVLFVPIIIVAALYKLLIWVIRG
jgi:hypothetical protein